MEKTFTLQISSPRVRITDPCYTRDTSSDCYTVIPTVKTGAWNGHVITFDSGDWGVRVANLILIHESESFVHPASKDWILCGSFAVDSGLAGVFPENTFVGRTDENADWFDDLCYNIHKPLYYYITPEQGVLTPAGFGDGYYACFTIRNKALEVVAIHLCYDVDRSLIPEGLDDYTDGDMDEDTE